MRRSPAGRSTKSSSAAIVVSSAWLSACTSKAAVHRLTAAAVLLLYAADWQPATPSNPKANVVNAIVFETLSSKFIGFIGRTKLYVGDPSPVHGVYCLYMNILNSLGEKTPTRLIHVLRL